MKTFAAKVLDFYSEIDLDPDIQGVEVMNPYRNAGTIDLVTQFFNRFYADCEKRNYIFGINPGRFGAGVTGISFTDPVNLKEKCGIHNTLPEKHELSSQFIFAVIEHFGSVEDFFKKFFITAVSPLGFVKEGKNMNYYDTASLQEAVTPFIADTMRKQLEFGAYTNCAICVGGDKNFRFMKMLNQELKLFNEIIPLEHPRYIMQYRRKSLSEYLKKYLNALKKCEEANVT
jgi:hypothetical protein